MTLRRYMGTIGGLLLLVAVALLASDRVILGVDLLSRYGPYRDTPALASQGPFLQSWGISDSVLSSYPALTYLHRVLQQGELPLWSPLEGLGFPVLASSGLGYSFLPHWLLFGLLPPLLAWHLQLASILSLAAGTSFALFCRLSGSPHGAALGASAWTFGGWLGAYLQLPSYAWSLALFPALLLSLERLAERRPSAPLELGLGSALLLTVGHLQMIAPILLLVALWLGWRARQRWLAGLASLVAGAVMASYSWVPHLELLLQSERPRVPLDNLLATLLLPREYLGLVFPTLLGQPSDNFYFGNYLGHPVINSREHCLFVGVVTLLLALLAVGRASHRWARPLAGMALLGLVLAGWPWFYGQLCRVIWPLTYLTPTRFLPFPLFAMCLLAAQGWSDLSQRPLSLPESRRLRALLGLFTVGAMSFVLPAMGRSASFFAWLGQVSSQSYGVKPPNFEGDFGQVLIARILDHFHWGNPTLAVSLSLVLTLGALLHWGVGRAVRFTPIAGCLALDLVVFSLTMNPSLPRAAAFPPHPDLAWLGQGTRWSPGEPMPDRVTSLGDGIFPNLLVVEGIANLESYESAHSGDYRALMVALNRGYEGGYQDATFWSDPPPPPGAFDLLGIRRLYDSPRHWDARYGTPDHRGTLLGRERATPLRAYLISRYRLADRPQALQRMMEPAFDPRQEALLDSPPPFASSDQPHFQAVTPTHYSGQRVEFVVDSDRPCVLVLTDLHYPGWRVTVNGRPQPLLKAHGFARAVALEAGSSQVQMSFRPTGFPYTPWLGGLTLLLLLGTSLASKRRSQLPGSEAPAHSRS